MKKTITKSIFEDNQRVRDEKAFKKKAQEELEQITKQELERKEKLKDLKLLKDKLKLTEKIFNLGTSDFNDFGSTNVLHIYVSTRDRFDEFYCDYTEWSYYEKKREYDKHNEDLMHILSFFKDSTKDLNLLVDDLDPEAQFSITTSKDRGAVELNLYYYHPEMDKRNYGLFEKYGFFGKLIEKYW
jgi:hypothetical protein